MTKYLFLISLLSLALSAWADVTDRECSGAVVDGAGSETVPVVVNNPGGSSTEVESE